MTTPARELAAARALLTRARADGDEDPATMRRAEKLIRLAERHRYEAEHNQEDSSCGL